MKDSQIVEYLADNWEKCGVEQRDVLLVHSSLCCRRAAHHRRRILRGLHHRDMTNEECLQAMGQSPDGDGE